MLPVAISAYTENFSNIGRALLTLLEVSSTELWDSVMFRTMDIKGSDEQPVQNAQASNCLFFVTYIILIQLVIFPLLVSIIMDQFNATSGKGILTQAQRKFKVCFHTKFGGRVTDSVDPGDFPCNFHRAKATAENRPSRRKSPTSVQSTGAGLAPSLASKYANFITNQRNYTSNAILWHASELQQHSGNHQLYHSIYVPPRTELTTCGIWPNTIFHRWVE